MTRPTADSLEGADQRKAPLPEPRGGTPSPRTQSPEHQAWSCTWRDVADRLGVEPTRGLSTQEVARRRRRFGANRLREARRISAVRILARQFESMIVLLLVAATALAIAFGQGREALVIAAVIVLNAAIGFVTELRAVRSMEALRQLGRVQARVRREGAVHTVAGIELVPGDIVTLEAGDLVPADLRLAEVSKLQADESALTGESAPVGKDCEPLDSRTPLAERRNMLFRGTVVTRGSAAAIVVGTGMDTEIGRIATLVEEAKAEQTPLERRLESLGTRLVWVTLGVAALVTVSGVLAGKDLLLMIETGIALAVASVPEGLPIVATMALARGMWRLAHRNALVNRLSAVEALGATTVICSDKTGTLTENRMTVTRILLESGTVEIENGDDRGRSIFLRNGQAVEPGADSLLETALQIGALCNNAELGLPDTAEAAGEPTEVALLLAARKAGIERKQLLQRLPEAREEAFVAETKMMATFHRDDGRNRVAVKGAPEAVLPACTRLLARSGELELTDESRRRWLQENEQLAATGLRVLALATKATDTPDAPPYETLVFVGLVGLMDPPRSDVRRCIDECKTAGIRVVMVTGDQPGTARTVGVQLGLLAEGDRVVHGDELRPPASLSAGERRRILDASILARVSPKQKLDLITVHQQNAAIVAMTGDGVNDAPALKKADIGVAMGKRGTQVAAQAADMVLRDDSFATLVAAVAQGRIIFDNIRKFVLYLLSCNLSEVLVVGVATLVRLPLPILPLQILFLNLVTDVFPALALGFGEGDRGIMRRPPRDPKTAVLEPRHWLAIAGYGLLITAAVLCALTASLEYLGLQDTEAVTTSFLTLAFAQLWHVFNMRATSSGWFANEVTRNAYVWGALLLCVALILTAVYLAPLAEVLQLQPPSPSGWGIVVTLSLAPLGIGQAAKSFRRRRP